MNHLKKLFSHMRQPVAVTLVLMLLCGLVFPLLLTLLSSVIFPYQAGGSLIEVNSTVIGSEHVGQEFTEPYFMKSRPSAVQYNVYHENEAGEKVLTDGTPYAGPASGSANYGPTNPKLVERTEADIEAFLAANPGVKREDLPADLVTASGSGLDPHISPKAAEIQIPAISKASGLTEEELHTIVENHTDGKLLGIFGEETVNVLGVNLEIAQKMGLLSK